jgi:hypothetical protein
MGMPCALFETLIVSQRLQLWHTSREQRRLNSQFHHTGDQVYDQLHYVQSSWTCRTCVDPSHSCRIVSDLLCYYRYQMNFMIVRSLKCRAGVRQGRTPLLTYTAFSTSNISRCPAKERSSFREILDRKHCSYYQNLIPTSGISSCGSWMTQHHGHG